MSVFGDITLAANVENLILADGGAFTYQAGGPGAFGNELANTLHGNRFDNTLHGADGDDALWGGDGSDILFGDAGDDTLQGEAGWDHLYGGDGNDVLAGGIGGDTLDGGAGTNILRGGADDDIYVVNSLDDHVEEADENGNDPGVATYTDQGDTVKSSISYTLGAYLENLELTGTASISATGNTLANMLSGNAGHNVLDGAGGADLMKGEGTDTMQSSVSCTLGANIENGTLADAGNISLTGNELANMLTGNAGDNVLDGAGGADLLSGGAGNDTYKFGRGGGADWIVESGGTADELDFSLTGGSAGRIDFDQLWFSREQGSSSLTITVMGTGDSIRIADWFTDDAHKVESIVAAADADGTSRTLSGMDVDLLVDAMAAMAPPSGATSWDALTSQQQSQLQGLAVWR